MAVYKEWGVQPTIEKEEQFLKALSKYGIRYLLIQEPMPMLTHVEKLIRQSLNTDKFEKSESFQIICSDNLLEFHLYRFKGDIDDHAVIPPIHLPVVGKIIE